ncbi:MAG: endolytic transglycosylase MltG [Myxococcota bacterium]|nr:endolytic transglycosylase MltG [Myxococcota bacterium]
MLWWLAGCTGAIDQPLDPSDTTPVVFEVPKGATAGTLGPKLVDAGLIGDELSWKLYLKRDSAGSCLKAGRFELSRAMNMPEMMEAMCGAPIAEEVPVTLVEGWRLGEIDAELSRLGLIAEGSYLSAAQDPSRFTLPAGIGTVTSLEGLLLPETYSVPKDGVEVDQLIQRQIDLLVSRFVEPNADEIAKSGRSLYELIIVASMLEREEPRPSNRPLVAGVMWKRLDNAWNLGIDATSRYTLDDWNDRKAFLRQLRDPADPYNTRLRAGLPPTPIGNPSVESLEAALRPEGSEYWYYLHDSQGNLHPGRSLAEHNALKAKHGVY